MSVNLQKAMSKPVTASFRMSGGNQSVLMYDAQNDDDDDSDDDDLDRFWDIGLREQLFVTLSRTIKLSKQTHNVTETELPSSIKRKKKKIKPLSRKQKEILHKVTEIGFDPKILETILRDNPKTVSTEKQLIYYLTTKKIPKLDGKPLPPLPTNNYSPPPPPPPKLKNHKSSKSKSNIPPPAPHSLTLDYDSSSNSSNSDSEKRVELSNNSSNNSNNKIPSILETPRNFTPQSLSMKQNMKAFFSSTSTETNDKKRKVTVDSKHIDFFNKQYQNVQTRERSKPFTNVPPPPSKNNNFLNTKPNSYSHSKSLTYDHIDYSTLQTAANPLKVQNKVSNQFPLAKNISYNAYTARNAAMQQKYAQYKSTQNGTPTRPNVVTRGSVTPKGTAPVKSLPALIHTKPPPPPPKNVFSFENDNDDDLISDIPDANTMSQYLCASEKKIQNIAIPGSTAIGIVNGTQTNKTNKLPKRARGATFNVTMSDKSNMDTKPSDSNIKNGLFIRPSATSRADLTRFTVKIPKSSETKKDEVVNDTMELDTGQIVLKKKKETINVVRDFKNLKSFMFEFEKIHQIYAREFTENIFDGVLKSYQRSFVAVSPQNLGIYQFSGNLRNRRRAVFGGDISGKKFKDTSSVMPQNGKFMKIALTQMKIQLEQDKIAKQEKMKKKKKATIRSASSKDAVKEHFAKNGVPATTVQLSPTQDVIDDLNQDVPIGHAKRNSRNMKFMGKLFGFRKGTKVEKEYTTNIEKNEQINNDINLNTLNDDDNNTEADFNLRDIINPIQISKLRRGDLIFIVNHDIIDMENIEKDLFIKKYQKYLLEKINANSENPHKIDIINFIQKKKYVENMKQELIYTLLIQQGHIKEEIDEIFEELEKQNKKIETFLTNNEWASKVPWIERETHVMMVIQVIGESIEVAHVTSFGGIKSFLREFNPVKVIELLQNKQNNSNIMVDAFGRGFPVAYKCIVYRLITNNHETIKKIPYQAGNVAENLVSGGRVLSDQNVFKLPLQAKRFVDNKNDIQKSFGKYLLDSNHSLFRRQVRIDFDEGTSFFNFSASQFVALCYQRAIVNKKSFDKKLIRVLDCDPYITPTHYLIKYLHTNSDWKLLGNLCLQFM